MTSSAETQSLEFGASGMEESADFLDRIAIAAGLSTAAHG